MRVRLIERICRLPEEQLANVEAFLNQLEQSPSTPIQRNDWPHAPLHRLTEHGAYIVTASTIDKNHFFRGEERLTLLEAALLELAKQYEIQLEAWAVFSNHYHFVAHTEPDKSRLANFISRLHTKTAAEVNRLDGKPERQVWFIFGKRN